MIGRTDDLLIVKGVKLYPAAASDLVAGFVPRVSGALRLRRQRPAAARRTAAADCASSGARTSAPTATRRSRAEIAAAMHQRMSVRPEVEIVDPGSIERTSHKAKLIEVVSGGADDMINDNIPAIDAWCNPFTELGIKTIFTENPEVAFMMGDQWGRHDNMRWHTADEFVAYMDELNISARVHARV